MLITWVDGKLFAAEGKAFKMVSVVGNIVVGLNVVVRTVVVGNIVVGLPVVLLVVAKNVTFK